MSFESQFEKYEIKNFGLIRLPKVEITDKQKRAMGLLPKATNLEFLTQLAREGWKKKRIKIKKERIQEYAEQVKYELAIVEELGFTDYFLLVWMVINKARELGAYLDFGRGSAAASLVFWLIDVTGIDPIEKKLIFERFISRARSKKHIVDGITYIEGELAPDVDINIGNVRPQVIEWLKTVYQGKLCKISALSTMTGKILIKDVYKTINEVNEEEAKRVADLVEKHFGIVEDIGKMPEKSKEFKIWSEKYPETFMICLKLQNLIRQKTSHASGYFISYDDLDGLLPMELNREKELTASYEMTDICKLGIKLDLLGLTQNEILNEIQKDIPEKFEDIELDENKVIYDQFQYDTLLPYGIYQISADCAYKVASKIKPKNIFELSDVNACARPGALSYVDEYVQNTKTCPHPLFEKILRPTRYFCLYQEQMMQMAVAIGFTKDEAELLRKVVGKKLVKDVAKWQERIYDKVKENGLPKEVGDLLWEILSASAKYSFNLAHSLCVSYLGALTVYLKYKYPLQFYKACLNATKNLPTPLEDIQKIQQELKYFGIKLLPPDLIKSDLDFKIEGNNIRFGLLSIKGCAEKSMEKLLLFKKEYANKFEVFEAANQAKISVGLLNALTMAGCIDSVIKCARSYAVAEAQLWSILTDKEKTIALKMGKDYNFDLMEVWKVMKTLKNDKGKFVVKETRGATVKKKFKPFQEIYDINFRNQNLANFYYERAHIGFSYSTRLIDIFKPTNMGLKTIEEAKCLEQNDLVSIVGWVEEAKEGISREKKKRYLKIKLCDETGFVNCLMFENDINSHKSRFGRMVKEEDIVEIKGKKFNDAIFCNEIRLQTENKVYIKLAELKSDKKEKEEIEKKKESFKVQLELLDKK